MFFIYSQSFIPDPTTLRHLSAPCAYLVAIILTLEYETISSIFLRINQEPHKL